jgi:hypothetical protein
VYIKCIKRGNKPEGKVVLKQDSSLKKIKIVQPCRGCQTFQPGLRDGKKVGGGTELEKNSKN